MSEKRYTDPIVDRPLAFTPRRFSRRFLSPGVRWALIILGGAIIGFLVFYMLRKVGY